MTNQVDLNLDVSSDNARALHRVVRAMHDGHCPECGHLAPSEEFRNNPIQPDLLECPECGFYIREHEARAALALFRPILARSLDVFNKWRETITEDGATT